MEQATAQALRLLPRDSYNGGDMLDDPFTCEVCGEHLPEGGYRCPDCAAPVPAET